MNKPSKGAMQAAKRIITTCGRISKFEFSKGDISDAAAIIEAETNIGDMIEAIQRGLSGLDHHPHCKVKKDRVDAYTNCNCAIKDLRAAIGRV